MTETIAGAVLLVLLLAAALAVLHLIVSSLFIRRSTELISRDLLSITGIGLLGMVAFLVPFVGFGTGWSKVVPILVSSLGVLLVASFGFVLLSDLAIKARPRSQRWWGLYLLLCVLAATCAALIPQP